MDVLPGGNNDHAINNAFQVGQSSQMRLSGVKSMDDEMYLCESRRGFHGSNHHLITFLVSRQLVLLFPSPFYLRYTFLPTYLITMADRAAP